MKMNNECLEFYANVQRCTRHKGCGYNSYNNEKILLLCYCTYSCLKSYRYIRIYEAWSKQLLPCLSSIEQAVNFRQAVTRRLCVSSFCKDAFKHNCKDVFGYIFKNIAFFAFVFGYEQHLQMQSIQAARFKVAKDYPLYLIGCLQGVPKNFTNRTKS